MNFNTVKYFLQQPRRVLIGMSSKGMLKWMPDKLYLRLVSKEFLGYTLNLDEPRSFSEKVNWLKLYNRRPEYTQMVDKYAAREYIAGKIGEEYLIPLVGGPWENFGEIDFDALPNEFVLKTTHDCGGVVICRDKSSFDIKAAEKKLCEHLKKEYFWTGREWAYKNVHPRIIAEKYMGDENGVLDDYKFWCFNGYPKLCHVSTERFSGEGLKVTYFDRNWVKQDFERAGANSDKPIEKPENYELMLEIAEKLADGNPFIRVDLYNIKGRIYSGELTMYPGGALTRIEPREWDYKLGSWIELPEKR